MRLMGAERADVVHDVPPLVCGRGSGKRGHRRSIEPGDQIAKHISIGLSALEPRSTSKVERSDRVALAVGKSGGRWSVTSSIFAVTGPAIHALEDFAAALDAFL